MDEKEEKHQVEVSGSSEDSFEKSDLNVEEEEDMRKARKGRHGRSYSITEMKDQIGFQKIKIILILNKL